MRKSLRSRSVLALLTAAALSVAVPSVAKADDPAGLAASFTRHCATGEVRALADGVKIRAFPHNTAAIVDTVSQGDQHACDYGGVYISDRYNGCCVYNANGWIRVYGNYQWGYSAMTCWEDDPIP